MTVPLVILAALSVAGGWIGWPAGLGGTNHFHAWLAPVFAHGHAAAAHGGHADHTLERTLALVSTLVALSGLGLGYLVYRAARRGGGDHARPSAAAGRTGCWPTSGTSTNSTRRRSCGRCTGCPPSSSFAGSTAASSTACW
jgi:hypothetical protein